MRPVSSLGFEPPMFRGLSGTELTVAILLSLVPGLFLAVIACLIYGSWLWALPVMVLTAFATVLIGGTVLRRLKRNRPPNWYLQRWARFWSRRTELIHYQGAWRVDR